MKQVGKRLTVITMIVTVITFVFMQVYVVYWFRFRKGFRSLRQDFDYRKRKVSVVIAARNESRNIAQLLTTLLNQSYDQSMYEIIIADDESTDNSREIIHEFMAKYPIVKLVEVQGRDQVISPKKNAMTQALAVAQGEIILTTDADCQVPHYWIESMVASFTDDVSMVVGYSRTKVTNWKKAPLVQKFEHFDFTTIYMAMSGSYTIGQSYAAVGQNLGYRKSAFEEVGGFSTIKHYLSGDDFHLMSLFRHRGFGIRFSFDPHSFVYTLPIRSWKNLLNQRSRWTSNMNTQFTSNPEFFWILVFIVGFYLGILLLFLLNWKIGLAFFIIKTLTEITFFHMTFGYFNLDRKMLWFYPTWILIQPFFHLISTIMGQFNMFQWHGRKPVRVTKRKGVLNENSDI